MVATMTANRSMACLKSLSYSDGCAGTPFTCVTAIMYVVCATASTAGALVGGNVVSLDGSPVGLPVVLTPPEDGMEVGEAGG